MDYNSTVILLAYCVLSVWFSLFVIMSLNTIHDNHARKAIQFLIHTLIILSCITVWISVIFDVIGEETFGYTIPDILMYFTIAGFLLSIANRNGTSRTVVEETITKVEIIKTIFKIIFALVLFGAPCEIAIDGDPSGKITWAFPVIVYFSSFLILKFCYQVRYVWNNETESKDSDPYEYSAVKNRETYLMALSPKLIEISLNNGWSGEKSELFAYIGFLKDEEGDEISISAGERRKLIIYAFSAFRKQRKEARNQNNT